MKFAYLMQNNSTYERLPLSLFNTKSAGFVSTVLVNPQKQSDILVKECCGFFLSNIYRNTTISNSSG